MANKAGGVEKTPVKVNFLEENSSYSNLIPKNFSLFQNERRIPFNFYSEILAELLSKV